MREPHKGEVAINAQRIHELAVPLGEAMVKAAFPILERYAHDATISPEEFSLSAIYAHCQAIAALIGSAVNKGAREDELRSFVEDLLNTLEPMP